MIKKILVVAACVVAGAYLYEKTPVLNWLPGLSS